jgi:hypothetical protein
MGTPGVDVALRSIFGPETADHPAFAPAGIFLKMDSHCMIAFPDGKPATTLAFARASFSRKCS